MLPKSQRIERRAFKPLLESKKVVHSEHFSLKMAHSSQFRAAVTVSKKVSKSAVVRNRIRRRVYSTLSHTTLSPSLYLIIVKPGTEKLSPASLESELGALLKKS